MQLIFKLFFFVPYLIPILFAFIVGFDRPATFVADSDLSLIDQALRFNSDARHLNVDHPSLTSVIVLGWWLKFTKFIGLTNVDTLQELFDHKNPIETLQSLVLYTRMLSLTIIEIYILVFFNFLRALQLDKCTIILSLILIASGEGILSQSIMFRAQPLSGIFLILALTATYLNSDFSKVNFFKIFKASAQISFFSYLAASTETSTIYLLIIFLPIILMFSTKERKNIDSDSFAILLLKYFIICTLLFSFLSLDGQMLERELTISNWIFVCFTIIVITILFSKTFRGSYLITALIGSASGLFAANQINLLKFGIQKNGLLSNFVDQSKTFFPTPFYHLSPSTDIFYRYYWNIISSLESKLHISWLLQYPMQILFLVVVFIIIQLLKNKNLSAAIQVACSIAVFILIESLFKLSVILPFDKLLKEQNFNTVSYFKIYLEFGLVTSFSIGLSQFIKRRNQKEASCLSLAIGVFILTGFSFMSSYSMTVSNRLYWTQTLQSPQYVCNHLESSAPYIFSFFKNFSTTCEEGVLKITDFKNSNQKNPYNNR